MPFVWITSNWTISSCINWCIIVKHTCQCLSLCVPIREFRLHPLLLYCEDPQGRSTHFWHLMVFMTNLAVFHCFLTFYVPDSFYYGILWLLSHSMWNHIDNTQISTWWLTLPHVENMSWCFLFRFECFCQADLSIQMLCVKWLFHLHFAEMPMKYHFFL